eukprot:5066981-Prymnesium_polylepis.3
MHRFVLASAIRLHMERRVSGSRPVVGSSRKTMAGSPSSEMASETRRFMPPLSFPTTRPAANDSSTDVADAIADSVHSCRGTPLIWQKMRNVSCTVSSGQRVSNCGQTPRRS